MAKGSDRLDANSRPRGQGKEKESRDAANRTAARRSWEANTALSQPMTRGVDQGRRAAEAEALKPYTRLQGGRVVEKNSPRSPREEVGRQILEEAFKIVKGGAKLYVDSHLPPEIRALSPILKSAA